MSKVLIKSIQWSGGQSLKSLSERSCFAIETPSFSSLKSWYLFHPWTSCVSSPKVVNVLLPLDPFLQGLFPVWEHGHDSSMAFTGGYRVTSNAVVVPAKLVFWLIYLLLLLVAWFNSDGCKPGLAGRQAGRQVTRKEDDGGSRREEQKICLAGERPKCTVTGIEVTA